MHKMVSYLHRDEYRRRKCSATGKTKTKAHRIGLASRDRKPRDGEKSDLVDRHDVHERISTLASCWVWMCT